MNNTRLSLVGYIGAVLLIVGIICPIISYGYDGEIVIYGYKQSVFAFVIIIGLINMVGHFFNNKATVFVSFVANVYFTFDILWKRGMDLLANSLDANMEIGYMLLAAGVVCSLIATIIILLQKDDIPQEEKEKTFEKVVKDDGFRRLIGNHILGFREIPLRNACFLIVRNGQVEFYSKDIKNNDFNIIITKRSLISIERSIGVAFENGEGKNEANLNKQIVFLKELMKRSPIMLAPTYIKNFEEKEIDKSDHLQIYETNIVFINKERKEEKIKIESYETNEKFVEAVKELIPKKVNQGNEEITEE